MSACSSVCLFVWTKWMTILCLSACLFVCLFVCVSVCLFVWSGYKLCLFEQSGNKLNVCLFYWNKLYVCLLVCAGTKPHWPSGAEQLRYGSRPVATLMTVDLKIFQRYFKEISKIFCIPDNKDRDMAPSPDRLQLWYQLIQRYWKIFHTPDNKLWWSQDYSLF